MSHEATQSGRGELDEQELTEALIRCGQGGPRRIEFLRAASPLILQASQADTLELWVEDGDLRYRWSAAIGAEASCRFERYTSSDELPAPVAERLGARPPSESTVEPSVQALIRFHIDADNRGVLHLSRAAPQVFTPSDLERCEVLARVLGLAVANRRRQAALTERVKELGCMYAIASIAVAPQRSLEDMLQAIVETIPPAWQYPELTTARITLDGERYDTSGFETGPHRLAAAIVVERQTRGSVEVFYGPAARDHDELALLGQHPWLPEERSLIEGIARELVFILERKRATDERTRLQEQIRHADRLATIGELTAGVAHELNEPLGNILGFAQLLSKAAELEERSRGDVGKIVGAALHAREIIRKLMYFSRQTLSRRSEIRLNDVAGDALTFLEARCAKEGIELTRDLDPELPVSYGDPGQLQQVLVNLVVNAIQAMPNGGVLLVQTRQQGDELRLAVHDQGVGIAPELQTRIFLPFFTTKDVGEGTGLGLSVVHGIVGEHGGRVEVDSVPGRGSRFEVCLPIEPPELTEVERDR